MRGNTGSACEWRSLRDAADITNAVKTHSDTVMRVCTLYFHGRPEREDAFQDTFIKYAQSSNDFDGEEHVKAWLIRVATNVCKDMLKRSEAKTVLVDEIDEAAKPQWTPAGDEGRAGDVTEALAQLEEKYRVALYLKYYEGYTATEIAAMLDIPENTVYTNLARGREKLKEVLERGE